jgi:hypothetical protein
MVMICHKTFSKHLQTKWIPKSALSGHLGHGDTLGACGGEHGDEDEDDDSWFLIEVVRLKSNMTPPEFNIREVLV